MKFVSTMGRFFFTLCQNKKIKKGNFYDLEVLYTATKEDCISYWSAIFIKELQEYPWIAANPTK